MSLNGSAQSIGSPSRMRGKEGDELGLGQTIRITPAYAGKSKSLPSLHIGSRDHPRVCGEKPQNQKTPPQLIGSPPRVRGKALHFNPHRTGFGITPACAGKSPAMMVCSLEYWGSPPRMRGKAGIGDVDTGAHGITPACAGKSGFLPSSTGPRRDHPRMCGEKTAPRHLAHFAMGSPPHVRGKGLLYVLISEPFGITPAYAGERAAARLR